MKVTIIVLFITITLVSAYVNPVQGSRDSPDPGVVFDGTNFYAVTTEGWDGHHFPIWQSKDMFTWTQVSFVFMGKPSWAIQNFWAP